MSLCGFRPYPDNGAYGHWTCGRPARHLGRHRFNNYTMPRIPRIWRVRRLWGAFKADRRVRRLSSHGGYGYRKVLFPSRYNPLTEEPSDG